jgi:hypothetical protein
MAAMKFKLNVCAHFLFFLDNTGQTAMSIHLGPKKEHRRKARLATDPKIGEPICKRELAHRLD